MSGRRGLIQGRERISLMLRVNRSESVHIKSQKERIHTLGKPIQRGFSALTPSIRQYHPSPLSCSYHLSKKCRCQYRTILLPCRVVPCKHNKTRRYLWERMQICSSMARYSIIELVAESLCEFSGITTTGLVWIISQPGAYSKL
jgi:hypothetical protein